MGYATRHVVEGLQPRTLYRFRLKVTSPAGESAHSPAVSVSTAREPMSSEHLHRAVNVNDEELLLGILRGGTVKVDVPNRLGFTALMVAAQKGYTRLVKILISYGTDVNLRNGSGKDRRVDATDAGSGWTPLMRVSAVSGSERVASLLIEAGADVNVKDKDGKTPLMVAVLNNHEELVQLLLDKGADANVRNEFGKGILDMARVFDRQNMVALLEERRNRQEPRKSLSLLLAGRTPSAAADLEKESLRL
ncbi:Fibronectin type 3 and ankyrin repeat domains protein 1 [Myotis davidii]|uniref:Fibronectin type 3 and ankyrin repeat domains protein 1 n=1 Tax=Myotis davidii TaxID=225400 RepID=L5MEK5_MYODS|nr:Fibronectin type 3 and ankyrin repeat domains protein 1 [Myotis davidii]